VGWSLAAAAVVLVLSVLRVDVGAKVLGVLMVLELASLLAVAAAVLLQGRWAARPAAGGVVLPRSGVCQ